MQTLSTFQGGECASLTVDSSGRIVTICIGLEGPRLVMFDPKTLELLAVMALPPRSARHQQPVHRLLRRRILLSRPERPRGDPDHQRPDLGRRRDERRHRPRLRAASVRTTSARSCRRRSDHLRAARLERADLVCHDQGCRRHDRSGQRCGQGPEPGARRSATRSRSIGPAASSSSPIAPCTASTRRRTARRRSPGAKPIRTSAASSRGRPRTALERRQT